MAKGIKVDINGETYWMTPENTWRCTYDNDISDHVIHQRDPEDDERLLFVSRHSSAELYDALGGVGVEVIHRQNEEQYVRDFLGQIVVASFEQLLDEAN